jgi:hypothetical protein
MQVVAVATPAGPEWQWRLVNYAGEIVEESSRIFPTIATAVAAGVTRRNELNVVDVSEQPNPDGSTARFPGW